MQPNDTQFTESLQELSVLVQSFIVLQVKYAKEDSIIIS